MLTNAVIEQVNSTLVGSGTAQLSDCQGTIFTIATAPGGAALQDGPGSDVDFAASAPDDYHMDYTVTSPCAASGRSTRRTTCAGTSTKSAPPAARRATRSWSPSPPSERHSRCRLTYAWWSAGPSSGRENSMHMRQGESGFSLIELMVTMGIFTIIMGVMFQQIHQAQHSSVAERAKLDTFQEARAFMDLISRDLHEAGYPSPRSFAPGVLTREPDAAQESVCGRFPCRRGPDESRPGRLVVRRGRRRERNRLGGAVSTSTRPATTAPACGAASSRRPVSIRWPRSRCIRWKCRT